MMTFKQMNISEPVCRALLEKNYSTPTLIQEQAIPEALTGRDLLGLAQTGTGKTAAFAIPIIEQLLADPHLSRKVLHVRFALLSLLQRVSWQSRLMNRWQTIHDIPRCAIPLFSVG